MITDGVGGGDVRVLPQEVAHDGEEDQSDERPGDLLRKLRGQDDDEHRRYRKDERKRLPRVEVCEVGFPLAEEVSGDLIYRQSEDVLDLSREYRHCNTRSESHDDGIRYEADDRPETQKSHQQQHQACHERRDRKPVDTMLSDDTVDDDDECSGRASDLHFATTEERDDEATDDGCDQTFRRRYTTGYTEGDGQRQGDDTDDDACSEILEECLLVVVLQILEKLWDGQIFNHNRVNELGLKT